MRTPLLLIPFFAACTSSSSPPASFADASDMQLDHAFAAAVQMDTSAALSFVENEASTPSTGCPSVVVDGNHKTITGDCDTAGTDWHWAGKIVLDNSGDDVNVELDDFRSSGTVDGFPFDFRYDGTIAVTGADSSAMQISADLTVTQNGFTSHTDGDLGLVLPSSYTTDGASISVDGLGAATVDGAWTLSHTPAGSVTLHGADDMVIDLSHYDDAESCAPYTIGARTGNVCLRVGEPPLTNP